MPFLASSLHATSPLSPSSSLVSSGQPCSSARPPGGEAERDWIDDHNAGMMLSTRRAMALACLLWCWLLPFPAVVAADISAGKPDGSQRWGYVEARPKAHLFWLWYKSPQRLSTPAAAKPWPTVLWLQGGPGGSGVGRGNFQEIGPLDVDMNPRQWTWLNIANLIFVDSPAGTGYSYVDDPSEMVTTDKQAVDDLMVLLKKLAEDIPTLQHSPLYLVGESYGGKHAAMLGVAVAEANQAGTLNLSLGGVVLGDAWISPVDSALTYAQLLNYVSRLNDNAVAKTNKMALMMARQTQAKKYAIARQTFTDQLDFIDSQSDSVNMENFMLDTGMSPVLTNMYLKKMTQNTIEGDMNGPVKKEFKLIPKKLIWQEASIDVYEALNNSFVVPAIQEVDKLLSIGVNVTVYQGQFDVIASTIGAEAWVRKLQWPGLMEFQSLRRQPLHFCDSAKYCSKAIRAYVRSYKNFSFYWILQAGHMVPVDQPYVAFRMIASVTDSPGFHLDARA